MSTARLVFWTVAPLFAVAFVAWCLAYVEGRS